MRIGEEPLIIDCEGDRMIGILSIPESITALPVLIVVGGPQYRAGSHRQFTLLARALAASGIPSLRFDYRGMGDSEGEARSFEYVERDLRAAVDALVARFPEQGGVVLWGLCDAASAAVLYAYKDSRVTGLVLLNPWVRTAEGEARALVKHYYTRRILQTDFWRKLFGGGFAWSKALADIRENLRLAARTRNTPDDNGSGADGPGAAPIAPLPDRMGSALQAFGGKTLLVLSGNDLTAQEFRDAVAASGQWQRILANDKVLQREIAEANHTFATRVWRETVASWTIEWVSRLPGRTVSADGTSTRQPASSLESKATFALRENTRGS
jgi:exosortase A-associated hydrolase 1